MPNPKQVMSAMQAITRAAESAGQKAPVTAAKPLTGLQDYHTSMMDEVRRRAVEAKKEMDSFDYLYDKGQRVFTEHGAKNNLPPLTVVERSRHGNNIMWEGEPWRSPKIIDPETGKAKRTPYGPGYKLRREDPETGEWQEFILPESAIKGAVSEANGGAIRMQEGGSLVLGKPKSFMERLNEAVPKAIKTPKDPLAIILNHGYDAYKNYTGKDPVGDLQKELDRRLNPENDTGSETINRFEKLAKGGGVRMQVGGLMSVLNAGKAGAKLTKAEMAALRARGMGVPGIDFADPLNPKDVMRMSEALGISGSEGKTLNLTQADRSRVFGPNKGGTGFSGLQLTSQPHQQAGSTWGVGKPSHVTRMINANTPDTVWSTFIGSPTQHMSNPVTVERMYEAHKKANPSAELIEKMNKQLNSAIHPKTKKPIFPEGIDISDPASLDKAQTFDQRKAIAQAMTIGGEKKGEKATQEAFKIIQEETDPLLTEAPTYAVGNRLFTIDKDTGIYRPDLNKSFPEQTVGTDFGLIYEPAPIELAAPDFVKKFEGRMNKHGKPQAMGHKDLTATTPKQFISEEYLTNLQKEGYKDGGDVTPSFTQRLQSAIETHMAAGGEVDDNTTPDMTDGGMINYGGQYKHGGKVHMPITSLKQVKPRRYADAGSVEPLGAPDYQTGPQDSRMMELAGRMIKDQAKKEGAVLSTPEGRRDIALKVASHMPGLGMGGDLVALADWVQTLIPGLYEEKPTSVLDKKPAAPYRDVRELQRVPKFPLRNIISAPTGEEFQEKFKEAGIQGENEAPVSEFVGSLLTPSAIGKAAKAPRAIEGGLNAVTAAARRPFTPATATVEAVSPDLAKGKSGPFQDFVTKQMIGEGSAVPMTTMGGRKTTQKAGQGAYLNEAGELEYNPMVGINIPRAGNLSTNKALRADIATAGQELGQEAMAAHRFVPMATNQIKDASSMMIRGPGGRPLTNKEVVALANELPGMIATHSPSNGGLLVAPFEMKKGQIPTDFLTAQAVAQKVLGKDAKIQFGKSDPNKDLMYMPRSTYSEEGGRGTSQAAQAVRNKLKRMDQTIPAR